VALDIVIYFFVHLWHMLTGLLAFRYGRLCTWEPYGRKDRDLALT
jgi:hypothetical protein